MPIKLLKKLVVNKNNDYDDYYDNNNNNNNKNHFSHINKMARPPPFPLRDEI